MLKNRIERDKVICFVTTLIVSFVLIFLYGQTVLTDSLGKFNETFNHVQPKDNVGNLTLSLTKDAYLLRIKHIVSGNQPKVFLVNGITFEPNIGYKIRIRGNMETSSMYIPRNYINDGINFFEIRFFNTAPKNVTIWLSNYRRILHNNLFVLFKDSTYLPIKRIPFKAVVFIMSTICILLLVLPYFLTKILSIELFLLFRLQLLSVLPFIVFVTFLWLFSNINGTYKIFISSFYFLVYGLLSFFISEIAILFIIIWNRLSSVISLSVRLHNVARVKVFKKDYLNKLSDEVFLIILKLVLLNEKVIKRVKVMSFSDKCIFFFILLLVIISFFLFHGFELFAMQLANFATIFLILGIVIESFKLLKSIKQN